MAGAAKCITFERAKSYRHVTNQCRRISGARCSFLAWAVSNLPRRFTAPIRVIVSPCPACRKFSLASNLVGASTRCLAPSSVVIWYVFTFGIMFLVLPLVIIVKHAGIDSARGLPLQACHADSALVLRVANPANQPVQPSGGEFLYHVAIVRAFGLPVPHPVESGWVVFVR